jgi:FkbM family methyltransferase
MTAGHAPALLGIEVPRLATGMTALVAGKASDASALRRIVEVQAEDLVRLRRELVSARERLASGGKAKAARPLIDEASLREASEDALLDMIRMAQIDIEATVERSRWLRFGRRLGLARPTDWEASDWRSPYAAEDAHDALPGPNALRGELARLARLQEELSRSRWRKLGHRLHVSKPFAWDLARSGPWAPVAGAPPAPGPAAAETRPAEAADEPLTAQFVEECKAHAVDTVLDVGANAGQFGARLRGAGWRGHVVSFEPLSEAHAALSEAARDDALWDVAARCALGATRGEAEINVAANSWSSSLLPMAALHRAAAPQSAYSRREACPVRTLDEVIGTLFSDPTTLFALKIDTQGYEKQVLEGLRLCRSQVRVILCELSLVELYEGGPDLTEMLGYLAAAGYRCIGLEPAFRDPRSGRLLQVDGLFVAR